MERHAFYANVFFSFSYRQNRQNCHVFVNTSLIEQKKGKHLLLLDANDQEPRNGNWVSSGSMFKVAQFAGNLKSIDQIDGGLL